MNQCPYCKKNITPSTNFCINCGRDLRKAKQEIVVQKPVEQRPKQKIEPAFPEGITATERTAKKFTSFFNILVLLVATGCIFGFIHFTIRNKIESTADKSDEHVEIIG